MASKTALHRQEMLAEKAKKVSDSVLENYQQRFGAVLPQDAVEQALNTALQRSKTPGQVERNVRKVLFRELARHDPYAAMQLEIGYYEKKGYKVSAAVRNEVVLKTKKIFENEDAAYRAYQDASAYLKRHVIPKEQIPLTGLIAKKEAPEEMVVDERKESEIVDLAFDAFNASNNAFRYAVLLGKIEEKHNTEYMILHHGDDWRQKLSQIRDKEEFDRARKYARNSDEYRAAFQNLSAALPLMHKAYAALHFNRTGERLVMDRMEEIRSSHIDYAEHVKGNADMYSSLIAPIIRHGLEKGNERIKEAILEVAKTEGITEDEVKKNLESYMRNYSAHLFDDQIFSTLNSSPEMLAYIRYLYREYAAKKEL